jgi:hypothetical protein
MPAMFPKLAESSVRCVVGCREAGALPGTVTDGLLIPPLARRFLGPLPGASLVSSVCSVMIFRSVCGGRYSLTYTQDYELQ